MIYFNVNLQVSFKMTDFCKQIYSRRQGEEGAAKEYGVGYGENQGVGYASTGMKGQWMGEAGCRAWIRVNMVNHFKTSFIIKPRLLQY